MEDTESNVGTQSVPIEQIILSTQSNIDCTCPWKFVSEFIYFEVHLKLQSLQTIIMNCGNNKYIIIVIYCPVLASASRSINWDNTHEQLVVIQVISTTTGNLKHYR